MKRETFPLRRGIVYGPVHSRRLGTSLGINLFPPGRKICPFDCVYCEYGKTTDRVTEVERDGLPSAETVVRAVEVALGEEPALDYVTFSGHGEPTLHPDLESIVEGVLALRDRLQPQAKVAMLSCSGVVNRPEVRRALSRLDRRIMKLDAGDEEAFAAINRPAPGLMLQDIIDGLVALDDVVIQHMVFDGEMAKIESERHEAWMRAIEVTRPSEIQVYSIDRPTAEAGLIRVPLDELKALARQVEARTGIRTRAY